MKSNPPAADELAKLPANFKNRLESSVNDCKQKPIVEKKYQKFLPSTPKHRKRKSPAVNTLKAKVNLAIIKQRREVKKSNLQAELLSWKLMQN